MSALEPELKKEMDFFRRLALANYYAAYSLSAIAAVLSIFAGLAVAAEWFEKTPSAILSALPGALLIISERMKFEERSNWHWKRTNGLKLLLNKLRFEGKPDAEISAEWRQLIEGLAPEWPGLQDARKEKEMTIHR